MQGYSFRWQRYGSSRMAHLSKVCLAKDFVHKIALVFGGDEKWGAMASCFTFAICHPRKALGNRHVLQSQQHCKQSRDATHVALECMQFTEQRSSVLLKTVVLL